MRRHLIRSCLLLCAFLAPAATRAQATNFGDTLRSTRIGSSTAQPAFPQAIEHSDAYYTRLTIHRYGSYAELPLFGAEYLLGRQLINGTTSDWVKPTHQAVAFTLGGLFVVNTVTGVWNLIDSRHDKEGRGRRLLHAGLMLAADAGFAYTGTLASDASHGGPAEKRRHRNAALVSIGLATGGTIVMWTR